MKGTILAVVMAAVAGTYAAEVWLEIAANRPYDAVRRQADAAAAAGRPFDERTKLQVMDDRRARGEAPLPYYSPGILVYRGEDYKAPPFSATDGGVFPLATVSNRLTVYCRERGDWTFYTSDEHGFRNPPGVWTSAGGPTIMLLGDSYGAGACVSDDENIAAPLRAAFAKTLNLSTAGARPDIYLAKLREYGRALQPDTTVILFYGGNCAPQKTFKYHPFINRYLDPEFSQGLIDRQREIDEVLERFLAVEEEKRRRDEPDPNVKPRPFDLLGILLLRRLRTSFGLVVFGRLDMRRDALEAWFHAFRREVEVWNGDLLLVYMPSYREAAKHQYDVKKEVLALADAAAIRTLDVSDLVEDYGVDEAFYYPESHYRAAVYVAIGNAIKAELSDTGRLKGK